MNIERLSFWNQIPPVVKNLLAINIVLWLATAFGQSLLYGIGLRAPLTELLGMHYWQAEKFNLLQLVSYMFMHGGFAHVFFNMFALFMFGIPLERTFGSRRFLLYYLVAGIGAGVVQQVFWTVEFHSFIVEMNNGMNNFPAEAPQILAHKIEQLNLPLTVGASGAVFGLLLAFGWLFPQVELYILFIPIPVKARIAVIAYAVFELLFGVASFRGDNIAHYAHLGGMLFGLLLILWWKKRKII
jgi:membrane associated rhomboid family serine protease